jgi:histidine triad (HIT) family protein
LAYAYDDQNIFAKILRGEIPNDTVLETEHTLAFNDIRPQSPVHVLVIPKGAYVTFDHFAAEASEAEIAGFSPGGGADHRGDRDRAGRGGGVSDAVERGRSRGAGSAALPHAYPGRAPLGTDVAARLIVQPKAAFLLPRLAAQVWGLCPQAPAYLGKDEGDGGRVATRVLPGGARFVISGRTDNPRMSPCPSPRQRPRS